MAVISIWCKNIIFELKMTLSSDTLLKLKTTVLIHRNDRSVIPDNRDKFGFKNVHAVDIDKSERFLK